MDNSHQQQHAFHQPSDWQRPRQHEQVVNASTEQVYGLYTQLSPVAPTSGSFQPGPAPATSTPGASGTATIPHHHLPAHFEPAPALVHPSPVALSHQKASLQQLQESLFQNDALVGPVRRRQNSACDRCRAKKVKCEWRTDKGLGVRACDLCIRLGMADECSREKANEARTTFRARPPQTRKHRTNTIASDGSYSMASSSGSPAPYQVRSARSSISWNTSPSPSISLEWLAQQHAGAFSPSGPTTAESSVATPATSPGPPPVMQNLQHLQHGPVPQQAMYSPTASPVGGMSCSSGTSDRVYLSDDHLQGRLVHFNDVTAGGGQPSSSGTVDVKAYRIEKVVYGPVGVVLEGYDSGPMGMVDLRDISFVDNLLPNPTPTAPANFQNSHGALPNSDQVKGQEWARMGTWDERRGGFQSSPQGQSHQGPQSPLAAYVNQAAGARNIPLQ